MKNCNVLIFSFLLFSSRLLYAQDCSTESLAKIPGNWKQGIGGSARNVTPAELAREKATLNLIHKMIAARYTPAGAQATHAYAFNGPDANSGKNWIAGTFWYSIYVLQYYCDNKAKYSPTSSTATTFNIYANMLPGAQTLYAAELPDDELRGYLKLKRMPVKKDGYYFMGEEVVGDSHLPTPLKEYRWLITYNDTLPFTYLSRKEYLLLTRKRLEKTIQQNGNASGFYTKFMNNINDWLNKSESELSKPAVCMWNDEELFNGFAEEGAKGSFVAIRPNMSYYRKKLPRSAVQFFFVVFKMSEGTPLQAENMRQIQKAVDFAVLRKMLGK
jgi:hypothetical protein